MKRATLVSMVDGLCIMLLALVLLPHEPSRDSESTPIGNLVVEIRWPDGWATDVDLWCRAPGDRPVGYSNKSGEVFNLIRDDLGNDGDLSGLNFENCISRGAPDGEYVANVHLFSDQVKRDVPVDLVIRLEQANRSPRVLDTRQIVLRHAGQEITVIRLALEDGKLVPGSLHDTPVALRSAGNPAAPPFPPPPPHPAPSWPRNNPT